MRKIPWRVACLIYSTKLNAYTISKIVLSPRHDDSNGGTYSRPDHMPIVLLFDGFLRGLSFGQLSISVVYFASILVLVPIHLNAPYFFGL